MQRPLEFTIDFIQVPTWVGPQSNEALSLDISRSRLDRAKRAIERAQLAGISIYMFNACGLGTATCSSGSGVGEMARATGGLEVVATNEYQTGIDRVVRENDSYYLMGYRTTSDPSKSFRRIEVTVRRPDLTVRTRTGYFLPTAAERKQAEAESRAAPAAQALSGIVPSTGIPMRATAVAYATPGKPDATVVILSRLAFHDLLPVGAPVSETISLETRLFTPEGDPRAAPVRHNELVTLAAGRQDSVQMLQTVNARPGKYSVRVGAYAAGLRTRGSVYLDLEVPDFRGQILSMSGVVLGLQPPEPIAAREAVRWLGVVPTTSREYRADQQVSAFFQVCVGDRVTVQPVDVLLRILNSQGETVLERSRTVGIDEFNGVRTADITVQVPLAGLLPGRFLMSLSATGGSTQVRRDVSFVVVK